MKSPNDYKRKLPKEEINELPLLKFNGRIRLINDRDDVAPALERIRKHKVLGFDTETKPSFKKGPQPPPSLLQLASGKEAWIFRLARLSLPPELAELLADPKITKVGVAVHDDIRTLRELHDFEPAAFADLGKISRELGLPTNGLRTLAANLLGMRISKSVRLSNWAAEDLTQAQIHYAAADAWVSRELYLKMDKVFKFNRNPAKKR